MAIPHWLRGGLKVAAVAAPLIAVLFGGGGGCEGEQRADSRPGKQAPAGDRPTRATQPTTRTASTGVSPDAVTAAGAQQSAAAAALAAAAPVMMLDEQPMPGQVSEPLRGPATFPTGTLRITRRDDGLSAILYSNDPPEARGKGYHGNSFLFNPPPEVRADDVTELLEDGWYYKSASSEAEDTPNGIFLDGLRTHLQPADVMIRFEGTPPRLTAHVMGQFRKFTAGENQALSSMVVVTGSVPVVVEVDD